MDIYLDRNDKRQDSDHRAAESDKGWDFLHLLHRNNPTEPYAGLTIVESCVQKHADRLQLDYISVTKITILKLCILTRQL